MEFCFGVSNGFFNFSKDFIDVLFGIVISTSVRAVSKDFQSLQHGIGTESAQPDEAVSICLFFFHMLYIYKG